MGFTIVTLTGTYTREDGDPATGTVTFRLSAPMQDGSTSIASPVTLTRTLRIGLGTFSVPLYANDDPTTDPVGVTYIVTESITGSPSRSYNISIASNSPGGTVDLAQLAPSTVDNPTFGYALKSYVDTAIAAAIAAALAGIGGGGGGGDAPAGSGTSILSGVDYWAAGTSYSAGTGASNNYGFAQRVEGIIHATARGNGIAAGGTYTIDLGLLTSLHVAGGWGTGVATMHSLTNDITGGANAAAKSKLGVVNGLTVFIANARAMGIYMTTTGFVAGAATGNPETVDNFAMALNGSWQNDFAPPLSSGGGRSQYTPADLIKYTVTQNDSVTISLNGKECVLVVDGFDSAVDGRAAATYEVRQGATVLQSGTTEDQFTANGGPSGLGGHMPIPIKVVCPNPGPNTITVVNTNGGRLGVWYVVIPWELNLPYGYQPKTVAIHKQGYLPVYPSGATDATVDEYNALVDQVIASFNVPDIELFAVEPTGWDATTMLGNDNLHPNDLGHKIIADAELAALNALAFRRGQNYGT